MPFWNPTCLLKNGAFSHLGTVGHKAVKEAKAELIVQFGADHILKPDVYDNILAMRDSVLGSPLVDDFWTVPLPKRALLDRGH